MSILSDVVDYGVIGFLLLLSVWAVAVAVERWSLYRRIDVAPFPSALALETELTRRLTIIGTIAANAPYIGYGVWHHGDISYHGYAGHHGREFHYGGAESCSQGHGHGIDSGHPLRSHE